MKTKKAQSIINYEKEAKRVEARLRKIEKRWGGDIQLEFKTPLPKTVPTATEARKALKFIESHRLERKLLELTNAYRIVDGKRVEFDPQKVAEAHFQQTLIRNRQERERKATQRMIKKIYGASAVKVPKTEPVAIYPVTTKGLDNLIEGGKKILSKPVAASSLLISNFMKVLDTYPMEFAVVVEELISKMSDAQFAARLKALYTQEFSGKGGGSLMWTRFWDSKGTRPGSDSQMDQILRMLGASFDSRGVQMVYDRIMAGGTI